MGKKERIEREEKRESYATHLSHEKRKNNLIAIGVFAVIAVIVGYSVYVFLTSDQTAPGVPEGVGVLGSEHTNQSILVKIFGDAFDFSSRAYQIKSSYAHFEGGNGVAIHKHATGVTLGYLFDTLGLGLDDQCFVFKDDRSFCTDEDYSLKFFINGEPVSNIRDHELGSNEQILISYGADEEEIESQLFELEALSPRR